MEGNEKKNLSIDLFNNCLRCNKIWSMRICVAAEIGSLILFLSVDTTLHSIHWFDGTSVLLTEIGELCYHLWSWKKLLRQAALGFLWFRFFFLLITLLLVGLYFIQLNGCLTTFFKKRKRCNKIYLHFISFSSLFFFVIFNGYRCGSWLLSCMLVWLKNQEAWLLSFKRIDDNKRMSQQTGTWRGCCRYGR